MVSEPTDGELFRMMPCRAIQYKTNLYTALQCEYGEWMDGEMHNFTAKFRTF